MNGLGLIAVVEMAVCLYVAVLSWRVTRAPGWEGQRWFALIGLAGAGYVAASAVTYAPWAGDGTVQFFSQVQVVIAVTQGAIWIRYSSLQTGRARGRLDDALQAGLLGLAALALVPGLVFTGEIVPRTILGFDYRLTPATPLGEVMMAAALGTMALVSARFAFAWRRGVRHAGVHAVAIAVLVLLGVNDVLVNAGLLPMPFLSDLGVLAPMSIVGLVLAERFVEDSRALHEARRQLEQLVGERTLQLASREAALLRSEKLAAVGRLSAGVAHEISSPLGAVTANLHYLLDALNAGELPGDAAQAAEESLASLERIARIVRHLYDAGRTAGRSGGTGEVVELAVVAGRAAVEARERAGNGAEVDLEVEAGLSAVGEGRVVQEVLVNLLKNALRATADAPRGGRVVLRAARVGDRVRLEIADTGVGMCPETQRRAFEPFFSSWAQGGAAGLGLAVSRGLVTSLGGELAIESAPGAGTSVVLELPMARPVTPSVAPTVTH
jgi:signal transduction histidine kinase